MKKYEKPTFDTLEVKFTSLLCASKKDEDDDDYYDEAGFGEDVDETD